MEHRKKIADLIEQKLGYTNGWRVDNETYENECLTIADELIKLFALPVVVGQSEQLVCVHKYQDNICDWRGVRKCMSCGKLEKTN